MQHAMDTVIPSTSFQIFRKTQVTHHQAKTATITAASLQTDLAFTFELLFNEGYPIYEQLQTHLDISQSMQQ